MAHTDQPQAGAATGNPEAAPMTTQCHDLQTGDRFEVQRGLDTRLQIERRIRRRPELQAGPVEYEVVTEDGREYRGTVREL